MDNTEQEQSNSLKCSICDGVVDLETRSSIKWNQDVKKGYGVCTDCVVRYRGKKTTNRLLTDSYNYISTTVRQLLNRYSFNITERTDGNLRLKNYVVWNLRATSPNDYMVKMNLEIVKLGEKDYKYNWEIKLYSPDREYMGVAQSEKPGVPQIKEFLGDFMKKIGSDPYAYFRSTLKQIMAKSDIELIEKTEEEDKSEYNIKFPNGFNGKITVYKGFNWEVQVYRSSGVLYKEFKRKSFALPPLREFFVKILKEVGVK